MHDSEKRLFSGLDSGASKGALMHCADGMGVGELT